MRLHGDGVLVVFNCFGAVRGDAMRNIQEGSGVKDEEQWAQK
jgi:hypothetical protein